MDHTAVGRRSITQRHSTGDIWVDAKLSQAEERMAEARAFAARRTLLGDPRPPRRGVRIWLGSLLIAAGHRLLHSVPNTAGPPVGIGTRPDRGRT